MNTAFTRKAAFAPLVIGTLNLLALLLFYLQAKPLQVQQNAIVQFLPSEKPSNPLNAWAILKKYKGKKQFIFSLNNQQREESKMRAIRSTARAIKNFPDCGSYIRICLDENTSYQNIVSLINLMLVDDHKRYGIFENSFFIFPPEKSDFQQVMIATMK